MCHVQLDAWLSSNCLRLNPDKTRFMWLGGYFQLDKIHTDSLHLRYPSSSFPLLLVTWELYCWISLLRSTPFPDPVSIISTNFILFVQVSLIACYYHFGTCHDVHSDFGNALYSGFFSSHTPLKHQSILDVAAHLIGRVPRFAHISGFIWDSVHWFPSLFNSIYS